MIRAVTPMHELEQPLPLFPLPGVVHFPRTLLPLHVFEPRYRALVADLMARPAEQRLIGIALTAPTPGGRRLLSPGTAGRLVHVVPLADGCCDIVLRGEFRFAIDHEIAGKPYRRAIVRTLAEEPLPEPAELDRLQRELLGTCGLLASEPDEAFPVSAEELLGLARRDQLEELVNRLAGELDLPVLRKQQLLSEDLAERAASVGSILRSRRKVLAALRPFRRLQTRPELN